MWYFSSPQIVFGEDSLSHLGSLQGRKACIVTDANLVKLGKVDIVRQALQLSGMQVVVYDAIEPDPALETVRAGARFLLAEQPDWIIALGGGSVLDAAKGMWILYASPGYDPEAINPMEIFGLRSKAHFAAIPTTSGTGSEATWAIVLTQTSERRKLGLGSREAIADVAILDPLMVKELPARITIDTGLDALTHAIEGFTSTFHNDFTDGLCLKAAQLVFRYLPRVVKNGGDMEAREHMHNAATIAGLGFGNSMAALAHGMGHSLGAVFHVPHGRAVALFLPYTIEYCLAGGEGNTRYAEMAHFLGFPGGTEYEAGTALALAIRQLELEVGQPMKISECGIARADFERELDLLVENAMNDTQTLMSIRIPDPPEMRLLFQQVY